jgi:hypothetical protein
MQIFDHNIDFWEKRQFFRRKLSKIAENCDHNRDPRSAQDMINFPELLKSLSEAAHFPLTFISTLRLQEKTAHVPDYFDIHDDKVGEQFRSKSA